MINTRVIASNKWTDSEIELLKTFYVQEGIIYCSNLLQRTKEAIAIKAKKIGLCREPKWSSDDCEFLVHYYSSHGIDYCASKLNRTRLGVKAKANKLNLKITIDKETLVSYFQAIHGEFYDYSKVNYRNSLTLITIICPKHGEFTQSAYLHRKGRGCPVCSFSKGERQIKAYLECNNIPYYQQHKFADCKNINYLPFDFYLPNIQICIEYHGRQHYEPINHFGGIESHQALKLRDKIKQEYCEVNNLKLLVIKYRRNLATIDTELDKLL